eukprot:6339234-Pyramimonas_sp.AAC.1
MFDQNVVMHDISPFGCVATMGALRRIALFGITLLNIPPRPQKEPPHMRPACVPHGRVTSPLLPAPIDGNLSSGLRKLTLLVGEGCLVV